MGERVRRNKAIQIIGEILLTWDNEVYLIDHEKIAESILSSLEEEGMLPPETTEKSVLPGMADFKVNKWESE